MKNESSSDLQPVFRADLANWRAVRGLSLEVTPERVLVLTRPAFMRKAAIKAEFENAAVDSFKIEDERQVTVTLFFERSEEYFEFTRPEDALRMCDALREILGPLDEVSRSKKARDEEERISLQKDRERAAFVQSYRVKIWDAAENYRQLAAGACNVIRALTSEDWKVARDVYTLMWRGAKELDASTGFTLLSPLETVGQALSISDGPHAVKMMASFVDALAASAMTENPPGPDWQDSEVHEAVRPGWFHVRYFVLFSCLLHEATLACALSDWAEIEAAIDGLGRLAPIVEALFGVGLSEQNACLRESIMRRDVAATRDCALRLSDYLSAFVQRNRLMEVPLSNGVLPEQA
jgi:hypothetical protein